MNSIDYFSPEELNSMRGGVSAASAPGDQTAAKINAAYNDAKARLAAQRAVPLDAPQAPPPPSAAAPGPAPGAAPGPAPVGGAAPPTMGQRILNARSMLSNAGNMAIRGFGAAQLLKGGTQGNTSDAATNIFNGAATMIAPPVGIAANLLTPFRDMAAAAYANSKPAGPNNIGPELQKQITEAGGLDNLLKQQTTPAAVLARNAAVQPAPAPQLASAPAPQPPPPPLTEIPDGVPASGTGYFKNERTGAVTKVGTPDNGVSTPAASIPQSNSGGVFSSLLFPFMGQYAKQTLGTAQQARDYRHQQAQQSQDIEKAYKEGQIDIGKTTAAAHQLSATAAYMGATAKENPIKIVQDAMGNPIVVNASNPSNITATKPTPQQIPTLQEFMRQAKLLPGNSERSDAELAQYYKRRYGG